MIRIVKASVVAVIGLLAVVAFVAPEREVLGARLLAQDPVSAPSTVDPSSTVLTPSAYEAFIALEPPERQERFRTFEPESKAFIFRTHAERYLQANRARLSAVTIAFLEDHIAYMTPAVYRTPVDPEIRRRGEELYHERMECTLGYREIEAVDPLGKRAPAMSLLEDFWTWWDCLKR
jgi:hypothetical protein